ncbi:IS66 family insertion sequence element accessory protein TnpA [Pseudofulvimonas gallinarii]|uniref:IS66 family insertion sequence element accessory protein TnpA n=3 Tax=Pseudofulvimonas gallinarii TaxID=634155 RepID=UPI0013DE17A4|nr:hypothetical protein [Pseudofulvimonas gallinarii]
MGTLNSMEPRHAQQGYPMGGPYGRLAIQWPEPVGVYCRRHALSLASFGYWRRQLRTDRDEADCAVPVTRSLVPIRVAPASLTPVTSSMMEVCLGNGLRVRLAGVPDPSDVAALVRALSSC